MSSTPLDLKSYLKRIKYDGPQGVPTTLETLRSIQRCHSCAIPFENLDVLLGVPIRLGINQVEQKLIGDKRGGYCFEQNNLMFGVLRELGFEVEALSGRVRFSQARDEIPPRTHLFARVMLDGVPWLVDVGVGGLTPTAPIRMDTDEPQPTMHDTRRIVQGEPCNGLPRWFHQVQIDGEWFDIYQFTGEHMPMIDWEVSNWWTSTNPESKFRQSIMAAIADPDGSRHTLSNRVYTHRKAGETITETYIESSIELFDILSTPFGIDLPGDTEFGIDGL